jgi:hypothetical protein
MLKKTKLSLIFFLLVNFLSAQDSLLPFWKDIQAFKKHDSSSFPPSQAIVLSEVLPSPGGRMCKIIFPGTLLSIGIWGFIITRRHSICG